MEGCGPKRHLAEIVGVDACPFMFRFTFYLSNYPWVGTRHKSGGNVQGGDELARSSHHSVAEDDTSLVMCTGKCISSMALKPILLQGGDREQFSIRLLHP